MDRIIYIDNLTEEQKERFTSKDIEVLTPCEVISISEKLENSDALVVLCELNIDQKGNKVNRSDFYGIKLVQDMRRKEFMGKVLFVSFMEEDYIVNNHLGEIIKSIGHSFIRLPSSIIDWKNTLETSGLILDKLSHYDVVNHFIGEKAIIGEKIHAIESKIVLKEVISNVDRQTCIQIIKSTFKAKQKSFDRVLKSFDKITNGKDVIEFVKRECYSLFPNKDGVFSDKLLPEWSKWKVLWLDDEETDKSNLKKKLEARGGLKVKLVKTYQEAVDAWEIDEKTTQEICLVIADYRLNDDENACREKQGYHFLKYMADKGVGIGLIAYSGLTRRFLFESFKHYGVQVNIFSKIDFNQDDNNSVDYLVDQIIQMGDNHWMMRNNQPDSTVWQNQISSSYFVFKESVNYYSFEQRLSKQVRQNLDVFIKDFNNCKNSKELWDLTFTDTFKVKTSDFPKGDKKNKAIKEVLTTRRFAIGLFAFLKSKKNSNHKLLSKDNYYSYLKFILLNSDKSKNNKVKWEEDIKEFIKKIKGDSSLKNTVSKSGLTFETSWPFGLLPEEYAWLECDSGLGVKYLEENNYYWSKIETIRDIFKNSFFKSKFLQSLLDEGRINFGDNIVYFNDDFEPFIRSVKNIKDTLKTVYNNLDSKNVEYETQLTEFINLTRGILKEIEKDENTPSNIKTLKTFIRTLKIISKKLPKEIEFIDEEFSYFFAPWEFRVGRSNRHKNGYQAKLEEIRVGCLKSVSDLKFLKTKEINSNTYPYFEIFTQKDSIDENGLNQVIYKAILKSNIQRNIRIKEFYNINDSDNNKDAIDEAEKKNSNRTDTDFHESDYKLPSDVKYKLRVQLEEMDYKIDDFKPQYFTRNYFDKLCNDNNLEFEIEESINDIVMLEYNEVKYPLIENLDNVLNSGKGTVILIY